MMMTGAADARRDLSLSGAACRARQLLARKLAAFCFSEGETHFDLPAARVQHLGGGEGIARIVAFAAENEQRPGLRKQSRNAARDARRGLVHQRFGGDAARKRRLFGGAHLGSADDRRDQQMRQSAVTLMNSNLTGALLRLLLEDFFFDG